MICLCTYKCLVFVKITFVSAHISVSLCYVHISVCAYKHLSVYVVAYINALQKVQHNLFHFFCFCFQNDKYTLQRTSKNSFNSVEELVYFYYTNFLPNIPVCLTECYAKHRDFPYYLSILWVWFVEGRNRQFIPVDKKKYCFNFCPT